MKNFENINVSALSLSVLIAICGGTLTHSIPEALRRDCDFELGCRMLAQSKLEGHSSGLFDFVPSEDIPFQLEALAAFTAGMSVRDISFCLETDEQAVCSAIRAARSRA